MSPVGLQSENATDLWTQAWRLLKESGAHRANTVKGDSLELLHVTGSISNPRQRWVLSRYPAMNPAFALAEVVWILAGRGDTQFLTHWNASYTQFVGFGETAYGAYGPRLRNYSGVDQLEGAYLALSSKPASRQVLLNLWNPATDMPTATGSPRADDIPCNVVSMLKVADGRLHWSQVMRSNDLVRGLPYNLIQWTTVQEILAGWLDLELGEYTHYADSLHVYTPDFHRFHAADAVGSPNTDTIMLAHSEFVPLLTELELSFERMALAESSESINEIVSAFPGPEGYLNWIRVLASERSRRLGLDPVPWARQVSSPMLRDAITAWISQRGKTRA